MKQKTKGISLIVLVITIIIIIILAGAVILSLSNSDIINKAKLATEGNDFAAIKEIINEEISRSMFPGETFNKDNIKIPNSYSREIGVTDEKTIIIKKGFSDPEKTERAIEKLGAVYIPDGFEVSTVLGEQSKEKGLVIKDTTNGNEFVWVPVEDYSKFVRERFQLPSVYEFVRAAPNASPGGKFFELEPDNIASPEVKSTDNKDLKEVTEMYSCVKRYKGFYVARYEASKNISNQVIIQKDKLPWYAIEWGANTLDDNDLYGVENTTGALGKSRAMYPIESAIAPGKPVSTLIYSVQWDEIMRWYTSSGTNTNDSSSYGNYTSTLINTGSEDKYKVNNIYDLAGNLLEWTMENYSQGTRGFRGGCYGANPTGESINMRSDTTASDVYDELGFRPALYIK